MSTLTAKNGLVMQQKVIPTVIGVTARFHAETVTNATQSVSGPSGTAVGDLLVGIAAIDDNNPTISPDPPTGYTFVAQLVDSKRKVYRRTATADGSDTFSWTPSGQNSAVNTTILVALRTGLPTITCSSGGGAWTIASTSPSTQTTTILGVTAPAPGYEILVGISGLVGGGSSITLTTPTGFVSLATLNFTTVAGYPAFVRVCGRSVASGPTGNTSLEVVASGGTQMRWGGTKFVLSI